MQRTLHLLVLSALLMLGGTSCSTVSEPDPLWVDGEVEAVSRNVLWQMTQLAIQRRGFPISGGGDTDSLEIESGWRNRLQPFRGDGRRHQAIVRLDHLEAGTWKVEVRVRQQANMSIVRPTDLTYAEWEWRDDDEAEAKILLKTIESSLLPSHIELPRGRGAAPSPR